VGRLASEGRAVFLARTRAPAGSASAPAREAEGVESDAQGGWTELASWKLKRNAGRRYAAVSGDWNPIHLSALTARIFGFRAAILHGYCIEAMVEHALIERLLEGDASALKRVEIAFRAPIGLPARARLRVREVEGVKRFQVLSGAPEKVCAEGGWTA
jgi:acyl dehydratase